MGFTEAWMFAVHPIIPPSPFLVLRLYHQEGNEQWRARPMKVLRMLLSPRLDVVREIPRVPVDVITNIASGLASCLVDYTSLKPIGMQNVGLSN